MNFSGGPKSKLYVRSQCGLHTERNLKKRLDTRKKGRYEREQGAIFQRGYSGTCAKGYVNPFSFLRKQFLEKKELTSAEEQLQVPSKYHRLVGAEQIGEE